GDGRCAGAGALENDVGAIELEAQPLAGVTEAGRRGAADLAAEQIVGKGRGVSGIRQAVAEHEQYGLDVAAAAVGVAGSDLRTVRAARAACEPGRQAGDENDVS